MEIYNHFEYGLRIAKALKDVDHNQHHHRYFKAHGIEDLYEFDEKLSSVNGFILIAVDGCESESKDNGYDGVSDTRHYAYIVACDAVTDRPDTITRAIERSRKIAKQIRNMLMADMNLIGYLNRSTTLNGIGPIGDNFYGCMLSFDVMEADDLSVDPSFWNLKK